MIRDLVAGVLCGGVVSAVGLGVISQVAPGPQMGEPPVIAAQPGSVAPEPVMPDPGMPEPVKPELQEAAPQASVSDEAAPAPGQGEPAGAPSDPAAATGPSAQALEETPPLAGGDAPVAPKSAAPNPDSPAPAAPLATDAQPPSLPDAGAAPQAQGAEAAPAIVAQAPGSQPDSVAPASPTAPATSAAAPAPTAELPAPAPGQPADRLLEPGAEPAPAPAPADVAPVPVTPEPVTPVPEPLPENPPQEPAQAPAAPKILQPDSTTQLDPAPGLPKAADGVTVGRLPTIGAAAEGSADKGAAPAEAAAPEEPPADLPALKRYAAKFENPSGKPLFALVLTDDGSPGLDRAKLAALPFPVTFAVNPLAPNAAEAAATYRAGGKEVVMLASGLPAGATAADVEQSFQAMTAALPESVAVIDLATRGFQDDRALASQIVTILKADGRGLITYDRGLNAADQVARRDDLPAAMVFRDLDAQGEEVPMIRRYLDRAAFKAAQEGRVTVVGTTRPETVAAIMEWTIEGRAASITLAPASAVMVVQ